MNPVKKVAILSKGPAKKGQSVEKVVVLSTDGLGIVRYQPPLGPPGASGVLLACTRGSAAHQKAPACREISRQAGAFGASSIPMPF